MFKIKNNPFNPLYWIWIIIQYYGIKSLCERYSLENYTINRDGTVDVDGDVFILYNAIFGKVNKKLPIRFGKVSGNFDCRWNNLENLDGSPREVGGDFICFNNLLATLNGAPIKIGGDFRCSYNKLYTLKGGPIEVGGNFECFGNLLSDVKWSPRRIGGYFDCSNNDIESLSDLPDYIGGDLIITDNNLYSLPNKLNTNVIGHIRICGNPVEIISDLFPDEEAFLFSLDWDYLRHDSIIFDRFKDACEEAGIRVPKRIGSEYTSSEYEYI